MKFKFLAALIAAMFVLQPVVAAAQTTVDTRGLTESQVADLQKQAAQIRDGASTPQATAEKVNQYVEIGKSIGAGLGSAAHELNIAVNDFAKSPVGQVTMALIIFKVAGGKLIGVAGSIVWFLIMVPLWVFFFNKTCYPKEIRITYNDAGKRKEKTVEPVDVDSSTLAGYRFVGVLVLGGIAVAGFVMAFGGS